MTYHALRDIIISETNTKTAERQEVIIMTHVLNLGADATFEEFRKEFENEFGFDYFEFTEDIPTGKISEANHEFIMIENGHVVVWVDGE